MNRRFLLLGLLAFPFFAGAHIWTEAHLSEPIDTTRVVDIDEIVVVASPKEHIGGRKQAMSVTLLAAPEMRNHQIRSLKDLTSLVPNFYMPDYGSKLTSAIYIRGIGSRINTPAVGLYVDNVPYLDKSAFDINFYDIERMDVLRGPQGTLYGRNTMAGLMKVYTKNPFRYQGTDLRLSAANADGSVQTSLTHYHRISSRFAFSAGGFYRHTEGFFKNEYLNKKADGQSAAGGRMRAIWLPKENLKIDATLGYEYNDEGGYAYHPYDPATGTVGALETDTEGGYRRAMLHAGVQVEYQSERLIWNAITGYQHLDDRMVMDQDFSAKSVYTLRQMQQQNSYTEELSVKNRQGERWQWVTGAFLSFQRMHTQSPVDFDTDGMTMLSNLINSNLPNTQLNAMNMSMNVQLNSETLPIATHFRTPNTGLALFHQSTFNDLLVDGLSLTLGLRLDHERMSMEYYSGTSLDYDFTFSSTRMPINLKDQTASSVLQGKLKNDYTELLPKASLQYALDKENRLYLSVARGFRSGGYNLQMFSDLSRTDLSNVMMNQVKEGCNATLDRYANMGMPAQVVTIVKGYLDYIPVSEEGVSVKESTTYRPEYSWNYEAGAHLSLWRHRLQADVALFCMDTRDQQISRFVSSGLGRILVNAGRSKSYGAEATLTAALTSRLQANASYGYTRAVFKEYNDGEADYAGNYVPFVPRQTMNVGATYTLPFAKGAIRQLLLHLDYLGTGETYWSEANTASQGFYGLYNGRFSAQFKQVQIDLWGRNLFNRNYHTFYFESMGNSFVQKNKPRQFGIDVRLHF